MGFDELVANAFTFLLFMCGFLFLLAIVGANAAPRPPTDDRKGPPDGRPPEPPKHDG